MKLFKICATVAVLASPLMADSISAFAVQQGHEVLLGNPDLVVRPTFYSSYLLLGSTMPSGFEGDIVFTLSVLGQDYVRTYDLTSHAIGITFYFNFPPGLTGPTPANLTVNFAGYPEQQYSFRLAPVPEPSSLALLGSGLLLALGWAAVRGRTKETGTAVSLPIETAILRFPTGAAELMSHRREYEEIRPGSQETIYRGPTYERFGCSLMAGGRKRQGCSVFR